MISDLHLPAKTKILATLGPAANSKKNISNLIKEGVNGIRLNMSHGSYEFYSSIFRNIELVSSEQQTPLAILADLQGPKIRIGELEKSMIKIETGNIIEITQEDVIGNQNLISTSYKNLVQDSTVGNLILIDDGLIRLEIIEKKKNSIVCKIINGGILSPRKGMNLPEMKLSTPSITEKDYNNLEFLIKHRIDYIALSFVRNSEDILLLKRWLESKEKTIPVIAKIEKKEAVDSFDEILNAADGIMIARGDLGVELSPQEVPVIQKDIIRKCNEVGKLVITATQMLESMINFQIPTRAEASDVANAVWDGTDVVMLSGETAVGKFPFKAVRTMNGIVLSAEKYSAANKKIEYKIPEEYDENLFDSVCKGITDVAKQINAKAIVVFTFKGRAARGVAKYRPDAKIIAISDSFATINNLCLRWGVSSLYVEKIDKQNIAINEAKELLLNSGLVSEGDVVIFMSRAPHSEKSRTDWLRFEVM
jgi:pyruvate kinase